MKNKMPPAVLAYWRKEGARNAKRQAANMTPEERKARATKASKAAAVVRTAQRLAREKAKG